MYHRLAGLSNGAKVGERCRCKPQLNYASDSAVGRQVVH